MMLTAELHTIDGTPTPDPRGGHRLIGRESELRRVKTELQASRATPRAVLITGEPGIGKSTLLGHMARHAGAQGVLVLRASGAPDERAMPLAGLEQLLSPASFAPADRLVSACAAIRDLIWRASEDNRYQVAQNTVTLIREITTHRHLAMVIDDVQWLDRASLQTIAFVFRRLEHRPVLLLVSSRARFDGPLTELPLVELELDGLAAPAAERLVDDVATLRSVIRSRLLSNAQGNPRMLIELAGAGRHPAIVAGTDPSCPLPERIRQMLIEPVEVLPAVTRRVLLVAALARTDEIAEILAAADRAWGDRHGPEALLAALDARLVEVDGAALRFPRRVLRLALTESAPLAERLNAHRGLAGASSGDWAFWHAASASLTADETLAQRLESSAEAAQRRGDAIDAYTMLRLAADRSPAPAYAGRRLLDAADMAIEAGLRDTASQCATDAAAVIDDPIDCARLEWIDRELSTGLRHDPSETELTLERIAQLAAAGRRRNALDELTRVAETATACRLSDAARSRIHELARSIDMPTQDPRTLLVEAVCRIHVAANPPRAIAPLGGSHNERDITLAARAAGLRGDPGRVVELAAPVLRSPLPAVLPDSLRALAATCAWAHWSVGEWDRARELAARAQGTEMDTLTPDACRAALCLAVIAAARGQSDTALDITGRILDTAPSQWRQMVAIAAVVRGVAALAAGDAELAFDHLHTLLFPADPPFEVESADTILSSYADAARQIGRQDAAIRQLRMLSADRPSGPCPSMGLGIAYAEAVLVDDEATQSRFETVFAQLARDPRPFLDARLSLAYGAWLRRHRESRRARPLLRRSLAGFERLGAGAWVQRADQELRASGETIRRRDSSDVDQLTPQEIEIGRLAATGLTNRQIGQRLHLSPRTVGTHLYRIFPKLGITSRRELAVPDPDPVVRP